MRKYKVTITKTYCIDVLAPTQKVAEDNAETILDADMRDGIEHYKQIGDTEFTTYDVTDTDDPFNP